MKGISVPLFKAAYFMILASLVLAACAGANTAGSGLDAPVVTEEPAVDEPAVDSSEANQVSPTDQAAPTEMAAPVEQVMPIDQSPTELAAQNATPTELAAPTETAEESAQSTQDVPQDSVTTFPDPSGFAWEPFVSGLDQPLDLTSFPDDTGRILILEQPGTAQIYQDGSLLPEAFLDIRSQVTTDGTEQGLLGLAFHPNFAENGFFYVNYTSRQGTGDTVVSRFQVSADNPNLADPDSEMVLLTIRQPFRNHNGGGMVFGPDGYLYISTGDGGSGGDPNNNGQRLDTLLGKLLRIDVNGDPYLIPADNPFAGGGGLPEIWAYGLRNPWRFAFDRLTNDMYIADVGQNQWEEINFQPADSTGGENYGWVYREGAHPFKGEPPADLTLIDPVFEYDHSAGCSVTGGFVYRGQELPEFRGIYIFSDFCSGRVWGLLRGADGSWQSQELYQTGLSVSSFGQDGSGELYLMDRSGGTVYRLQRQ